jgi:hypothetical protein
VPIIYFGASNGAGLGIINVSLGGIGFDGAQSNYNISPVAGAGLKIFENGNVNTELLSGQNNWFSGSDSTLKHNIVRLTMTPTLIRNLKAYTYVMNASDSSAMGVIAQDLEADFPEAVHLDTATNKLSVSYAAVAAIALRSRKQSSTPDRQYVLGRLGYIKLWKYIGWSRRRFDNNCYWCVRWRPCNIRST